MGISGQVYGKDSGDYDITVGNIAYDLAALGRYQEAADAWIAVADWYEQNEPQSTKGPVRKVRAYTELGGRGMDWEAAEAEALRAYEHVVELGGVDHVYAVAARRAIAAYYERWGRPDQAEAFRDEP